MGDLPSEISESELVGLNELEREARISEYAEKRQQYMERLVVKRRLQAGKKDQAKQRRLSYRFQFERFLMIYRGQGVQSRRCY